MEIVIKIPNNYDLSKIKNGSIASKIILDAVKKGTPLPKGHGKLVDIGKIDKDRIESDNPIIHLTINGEYIEAISLDYLNSLPTIIEANKEEDQ